MAVYALWKREAMVRFPSFPTKFSVRRWSVGKLVIRCTVNADIAGSSPAAPATNRRVSAEIGSVGNDVSLSRKKCEFDSRYLCQFCGASQLSTHGPL